MLGVEFVEIEAYLVIGVNLGVGRPSGNIKELVKELNEIGCLYKGLDNILSQVHLSLYLISHSLGYVIPCQSKVRGVEFFDM